VTTTRAEQAFEFERGPLIMAGILLAIGGFLAFIGFALGTRHAVTQGYRWYRTVDTSPASDLAKTKWGQLKRVGTAAGQAGVEAWRNSTVPVSTPE
jgi:hypothetical protein